MVLKQLLGHDERSLGVHDDLDSILASVADTDSDEQELGFGSQVIGHSILLSLPELCKTISASIFLSQCAPWYEHSVHSSL